MPILRAIVDSSGAVEVLTRQLTGLHHAMDQAQTGLGFMDMIVAVEFRRGVAHRLMTTSVEVLAGCGEMALPHVERALPRAPTYARRPLHAVRARILRQWWKFWLWV
jgi:hypothetical protein